MADIFETVMLLAAGIAGVLCGVALGATMDHEPSSKSTYTIANYWKRQRKVTNRSSDDIPSLHKENVVVISRGRKYPGIVRHISAVPDTDISENK